MAKLIKYKREKPDKILLRTYNMYYKGLLFEQKRILGPIAGRSSTMYQRELPFLIMLLSGLVKMPNITKDKRRGSGIVVNAATIYVANIDIILTHIISNYQGKKFSYPLVKRVISLSLLYYPEKAQRLEQLIAKFYFEEDSLNRDPDVMAGHFGNIFAEVFSFRKEEEIDGIRDFGYYLGKYIYIRNSYEKLRFDEKKNIYNPLFYVKKQDPLVFDVYVKQSLSSIAAACVDAFKRLPLRDKTGDILERALSQYLASQYLQR